MSEAFALTAWYTVMCHCFKCGAPIVVANAQEKTYRRDSSRYFYCINGHSQHFTGESEESKLKRRLEFEQQRRESAERRVEEVEKRVEHVEKSRNVYRGKLKAQTHRVKNGVCPCCNRTFQNLMRHMSTKHPGFGT